jgi:hypothetical protein
METKSYKDPYAMDDTGILSKAARERVSDWTGKRCRGKRCRKKVSEKGVSLNFAVYSKRCCGRMNFLGLGYS